MLAFSDKRLAGIRAGHTKRGRFSGINPSSGRIFDTPLNVATVSRLAKARCADAGLNGVYSAGSLHQGWALTMGVKLPLAELMRFARWKSAAAAFRHQTASWEYHQAGKSMMIGR